MADQSLPSSTAIHFNPFPVDTRTSTPAARRNRPVFSCVYCREKKLRCDREQPCNQCRKRNQLNHCLYEDRQLGRSSKAYVDGAAVEDGSQTKRPRVEPAFASHADSQGLAVRNTPNSHAAGPGSLENVYNRAPPQENCPGPEAPHLSIIESLECRIERLERRIQPSENFQSFPRSGITPPRNGAYGPQNHPGILTIKGSSTRYHGQNQRLALLGHFQDAKAFILKLEKPSTDPWMISFKRDLHVLQKALVKQKTVRRRTTPKSHSEHSIMMQILPRREICSRLVEIYLSNLETVYRVLHSPTFLTDFDRFWNDRSSGIMNYLGFLPQLLVVMAIGSNFEESLLASVPDGGQSADMYCDLVQAWLGSVTGKRRMQFSILQTQTLLVIARLLRARRSDELWNDTGVLVRSAMMIGLHRDPSDFPQMPFFQAEQRRRLWATVVELDLRISLSCGMSPMVRPMEFNCRPPLNLDDMDLVDSRSIQAVPKSSEVWTDTSVQALLATSLPCRLEVAGLLHGMGNTDTKGLLRRGKELEGFLEHLPNLLKWDRNLAGRTDSAGRVFARMTLDITLRSVLMTVYCLFVLNPSKQEGHQEARSVAIESSLQVLSRQDVFDPEIADADLPNKKQYWDFLHSLYESDIRQAAYIVCLEILRITHMPRAPGIPTADTTLPGSPQDLDHDMSPQSANPSWTKASLVQVVQNTLNSLTRRIFWSGRDAKDVFSLTLVLQSVRTENAQEKEIFMRQGAESLITTCQRQLSPCGGGSGNEDHGEELVLPGENATGSLKENGKRRQVAGALHNGHELDAEQLQDLDGDSEMDLDFSTDWGLHQSWL